MYIKSQRTVGSLGDADSSAGIFRLALIAFGAYWLYKNTAWGQKLAGKARSVLGAGPKTRDALAGLFKSSGGGGSLPAGKKCRWCDRAAGSHGLCSAHDYNK